jgi:CDP-paratose 2-epimerase
MQLGVEDQGWVAHMAARALLGQKINIFGDGSQVRDLLYVDDLINAYLKAVKNIKKTKGEIFNIGGGVKNAISVNGYLESLEKTLARRILTKHFPVRPGDQKYFVSDNKKAEKIFSWKPETSYQKGIPVMIDWIQSNRKLFEKISGNGKKH